MAGAGPFQGEPGPISRVEITAKGLAEVDAARGAAVQTRLSVADATSLRMSEGNSVFTEPVSVTASKRKKVNRSGVAKENRQAK